MQVALQDTGRATGTVHRTSRPTSSRPHWGAAGKQAAGHMACKGESGGRPVSMLFRCKSWVLLLLLFAYLFFGRRYMAGTSTVVIRE